jgi:hypothetical protein
LHRILETLEIGFVFFNQGYIWLCVTKLLMITSVDINVAVSELVTFNSFLFGLSKVGLTKKISGPSLYADSLSNNAGI